MAPPAGWLIVVAAALPISVLTGEELYVWYEACTIEE